MKEEARNQRQRDILDAALAQLIETGFAGTTMQAVARRAGASMETLYNWYGDKAGLFRALVMANIDHLRHQLETRLTDPAGPEAVLTAFGPRLLEVLTSERVVALNLMSTIYLSQAAHDALKATRGSIINISSVSAQRPSPGTAVYAAAKAGVLAFTRSVAHEWGPDIRINSVVVWREVDFFEMRERAALNWAERCTQLSQAHPGPQDFEALRPYFSEREIVELSYAIGCINVWNRLCVGFAAPVEKKPITV